jgi:hypothetical protein
MPPKYWLALGTIQQACSGLFYRTGFMLSCATLQNAWKIPTLI